MTKGVVIRPILSKEFSSIGDMLIWLTCNAWRSHTVNGLWFIRIISQSSVFCEHWQPIVLLKLPSNWQANVMG